MQFPNNCEVCLRVNVCVCVLCVSVYVCVYVLNNCKYSVTHSTQCVRFTNTVILYIVRTLNELQHLIHCHSHERQYRPKNELSVIVIYTPN